MTINFQLGGDSEEFVRWQLDSGRYADAQDVVRDALRLMEERDSVIALQKDDVRQKIKEGMDSLRAGRHEDGKAYFDRLRKRLDGVDRGEAW